MTWLGLALSVLGVAFVSAFLPVFQIETYVALVAASGGLAPLAVAGVAAVGQVAGKLLWFEAGRGSARWPWLQRRLERPAVASRLDRMTAWVEQHPRWTALLLIGSAGPGIPPFLVMSVVAGRFGVTRWQFVLTGLVGRFGRFLLVAGLVQPLLDGLGISL